MNNGSHHHRIGPDTALGAPGSVTSTLDSDATPADAARPSKGVVRRFAAPAPRLARNFALVLGLLLALGAGAAASASADGTIVAMKGGDRNLASDSDDGATNYALPLSGVTFEYTQGDPTNGATVWTDFQNQSAANGQASTVVPAGTYFVREKTVGTNFDNFGPVQDLYFDPNSGSPSNSEPYVARVTVSDNGTTYAYPHTNNSGNPDFWFPTRTASTTNNGSPFINVRNNEPGLEVCGLNILLVLDRSGSIFNFRTAYRDAAKSFVNQLNGTPTQIGITSFNSSINSYSPATGNSSYYNAPLDLSVGGNAATLNGKIDNIYNSPNGSTNWDGALQAAAQAKSFTANGVTGQTTNPDVVVFITDGNPTINETDSGGNGADVSLINLTAGMASANLVKNQDGRTDKKLKMLAIGVDNQAGSAPTADNLKAVSGPVEGVDGDYATPTISQLQSFLAEYAAAQCGARVYIRKHLKNDPTNQSDWGYNASDPPNVPAPTFQDDNPRTHGNPAETGAFYNQLPSTATEVTIGEDANGQPLNPFELTGVVCKYDSYDGNTEVQGSLNGLDYTFDVNRGDDIYCTFTNEPKTTLTVNKTPNNGTVNAGEDAEFTIAVQNTGTNAATNATLSDQLPAPGTTPWTVSQQPAGGTCSVNGSNLLTCDFGNIAAGATKTLKVKTTTSYAKCDVYDNPVATADADNASPVDDAGQVTCQKPNLTIEKTPNSQNINAGDDVVFTIQVDNAGPGTAKNVQVSDTLPGPVAGAWTDDSADCTVTGGNQLDCDFGDMASGASKSVTVKAPTNAENCATYDNTADLTSDNAPDDSDDGQVTCQPPGLGVLKTAVSGTINAGEDAVFDITVTNTGQGTATGVTLNDPLPSGVSGDWVVSGTDAGDCQVTGTYPNQTLECDFGDILAAPGDNDRTVTVTAPTDFDNCATLDNEATASSTNAPDASDDDTINCQKPNLSVDKTPDAQTINAGENVVFDITVSNSGPGTAKSVTVSDTLPGPVAGSWTDDSTDCSIAAGVLTCDFGDMASGASESVTVTAATDYDNCTVYDNTATASAANAPDDSDDGQVTCQKPNLTIEKTPNSQNINAGDDVVFTIQVDNAGPGTAKGVTLSDPLPSGTAGNWLEDPDNPDCSIAGGVLSCNFGDMASGASKSVTVKAATDYDNCTVYDNTATASATNAPNAEDDGQVTCQKPSLSVDKTPDAGTVNAGEDVEFTIQVSNAGPGDASTVTLNDPLPAGTAGNWTIGSQPVGDPCSIAANVLSCAFGDLAAGESVSVTVKASTDFDNCVEYDNTATASATNAPNASDDGQVSCLKPGVGTLKTAVQGTIDAGDTAVYTIEVSNIGPGVAKNVTLSDPLPGGVSGDWVEDPDNPDCQVTGGNQLDCDFGDMAANTSHTVTVKAPTDFEQCTVLDNTATASASNAPDADDDATITCQKPDLTIVKTPDAQTINAGENVSFNIQVANAGPGTAKSVTVSDTLPGPVAGSWSEDSTDCSIAAGVLTCDFGDMASGASESVTVTAATDYDNCTVYDNTATASASNHPDVSDPGQVSCQKPDLSVQKTGNGTVSAGENVTFTIETSNAGPGLAKNVALADQLPTGTAGDWQITDQPGGDPCSIAGGILACAFGDMAAGDSNSVTVSAATDYDNCATYDNTATASSTNAPDASGSATDVCQKPNLQVTKTGNGNIKAGEDIEFTIEVSNAGQGTATDVALSDPLPTGTAGAWEISSQPAAGSCEITNGTLSCSFGDMAAGASVTIGIKAPTGVNNCATYDNTATATATNGPDASSNDTVTCSDIKPNLTLTKQANRKVVRPGNNVKYTITVKNTKEGSVAKNLKVCDKLPSQMTVVKKDKTAYFDNGRLCWNIKQLAGGKSKKRTYTAKVNNGVKAGTKLKNVVTLGNKKATKTVRVKKPKTKPKKKKVPVTG